MTHTEMYIAAYLIMGIGYHFGQTFTETFGWRVIARWIMVVIFWPGITIANFISAIGTHA